MSLHCQQLLKSKLMYMLCPNVSTRRVQLTTEYCAPPALVKTAKAAQLCYVKVPAAALTVRSSNVPRAEGTFSRQSISSGQLRASQNVFNTNRPQTRTLSSALFYTESSNTAAPTRTKEHVSGTRWVQMLLERDLGKPDLIPGRSDKLKNEFSKGRAEILRYFHLILT